MKVFTEILVEARMRLPLRRLMEQYGKGAPDGKWGSSFKCPWCGGNAGVFKPKSGDAPEMFKCQHVPCPTDNQAFEEIGFVQLQLNLSREEAWKTYFKEAGVWNEAEVCAPSIVPGANAWPSQMTETGNGSVFNYGNGAGGPPAAPRPEGSMPNSSEDPPSPPLAALRWFYERLDLAESDLKKLWQERGLTEPTCTALGYKSNRKSNKELLLSMDKEFPSDVLLDSGLWTQGDKPGDPPKPNPQFYGMMLVQRRDAKGKKVRDRNDEVIKDCVWADPGPILIPYFNETGHLIHLRPHKGMMRGKTPQFYSVRLYWKFLLEHPQAIAKPQYAVITEGEFKAAALWQVMGDAAAVAALPGITMAKPLFGDIEEWLELIEVRQVVIGYDNEDKSNPELPGYQQDKWKRFDAQVWARYLARQIAKEGYEGKVCVLPDAWRNAEGKADWDGRLAQLVHAAKGEVQGEEQVKIWDRAKVKAQAEFIVVIKAAAAVREIWQSGFFDSEEEQIIKNGLERISWIRALPIGGDDEITIARRLQRLVARLKRSGDDAMPPPARVFLLMLASNYRELRGGYYIFKKLSDKQIERWTIFKDKAENMSDADLKRACELALKGIPQRISDFYMKAHYVLVKLNGTRVRLVTLHNVHGARSGIIRLPSTPFSQPSKFREWLLDSISGATWSAGERELNALQADIAHDVSFKEVEEVTLRGYHAESGCWFFGDVVFTDDGRELFADKNGIIWLKSKGDITRAFKLSERDQEGQNFCQHTPLMKPKEAATDEETAELFSDMYSAMHDTLGGYSGFLAIGAILACGAGPEIYSTFNGFPGLWVHGEQSQGKSSVVRWLMRIWGFKFDSGMPLADSTKVGLSIAMQQYGNLPVWLEEFQPTAAQWMIEKIKNFYNRESGIKKTFDDGGLRNILATAIITGVATCSDAQTKSRYAHVHVSAKSRIENHYEWFQENMGRFFLLGRYIMRHRKDFAERTVKHVQEWLRTPEMVGVDERARIVHGACYGGFAALMEMLKLNSETAMVQYREFLFKHCAEAVSAVRDQVNVNQFWHDLLDACKSDAFGATPAERRRIFKVMEAPARPSPVTEFQTNAGAKDPAYAFPDLLLYFQPGPVIEMLRRYKRLNGRDLPLDKVDLRCQMRVRPYWLESKKSEGHRQRFAGGKSGQSCWCISISAHELGLIQVGDEVFTASMYKDGNVGGDYLPREEWMDPRKGDLFALVESLKSEKD